MSELLSKAIVASLKGGKAILQIYNSLDPLEVITKRDDSPLTQADLYSNREINSVLEQSPYPVLSEENIQIDYATRKEWETCWIVDPLDGTKEFIKRNGEFTVNIALVRNGAPLLGVIYVPVTRELYYGDVHQQLAYKTLVEEDHSMPRLFEEKDRIRPSNTPEGNLRVVGSRSHMNQDTLDFVESLKKNGKDVTVVSKGSSLKFCLVAEGNADIYPRFAPTMEWDTAAGHAICRALGISVTLKDSREELRYNKEDLLNPHFLVSL